MLSRPTVALILIGLAAAASGCPSPCDDSFVNGNGQCPEGCAGWSVFHIIDVCANWVDPGAPNYVPSSEGLWCTEIRGTRPVTSCVIEESTGEMYMTRYDPTTLPNGVRLCTEAEREPPACFPPAAP